jgi:hypothetical protein
MGILGAVVFCIFAWTENGLHFWIHSCQVARSWMGRHGNQYATQVDGNRLDLTGFSDEIAHTSLNVCK